MLKAHREEGIAVTQLIRKFSLLQLFSKSQGRNLTRNKIETRFLDKVQHSHKEHVFGGLYFLFIFLAVSEILVKVIKYLGCQISFKL